MKVAVRMAAIELSQSNTLNQCLHAGAGRRSTIQMKDLKVQDYRGGTQ